MTQNSPFWVVHFFSRHSPVGCGLGGRARARLTSSPGPPLLGFPGASDGKESACNAGDPGLIPGLERSPGEKNGNPLQDSCLEN